MTRVIRVEKLRAVAPAADGRFLMFAFDVEVTVEGEVDPSTGMVIDLGEMKRVIRREVIEPLEGRCLDGREGRPECGSPEELARIVWERLDGRFGPARLARVRLASDPAPIVEREGEGGVMTSLTRSYEFAAAHRLHAKDLTESENARVFGRCNNPHGHGHNYVLEVTVRGAPTGCGDLLDAETFDRIVHEAVVDRWDHRHLNLDVPEFAGVNPTAEEIVRIAWDRMAGPLKETAAGAVRLHRVKLRETGRNHVEYEGGET